MVVDKDRFSEQQFRQRNVYCYGTMLPFVLFVSSILDGAGLMIFGSNNVYKIAGIIICCGGFIAHTMMMFSLSFIRAQYRKLGEW